MKIGKILVACEYSGVVRNAFAAKGWDAWSCDLLPSETEGNHYQGDVNNVLPFGWDMMIAHPPCTYLCSSGMHWTTRGFRDPKLTSDALSFVNLLLNVDIKYIALENPVGRISTAIRKPDQIIQPWQFGHEEKKATCLWLKGLPILKHTKIMEKREQKNWLMSPSPNRWKERSRTYKGIADAMADQWTEYFLKN